MGKNVILWDFDGTLGYSTGMWNQALLDMLLEQYPTCTTTLENIRPLLRSSFPWHQSPCDLEAVGHA